MVEHIAGELGETLDIIARGHAELSRLNEQLCQWLPGVNVTTAVLEKASVSPVMFHTTGMATEQISAYLDYYWRINPWNAFWPKAGSGIVYKTTEHFSSARFKESEFFNDFLLKLGTPEPVVIRLENSKARSSP